MNKSKRRVIPVKIPVDTDLSMLITVEDLKEQLACLKHGVNSFSNDPVEDEKKVNEIEQALKTVIAYYEGEM